MKKKTWAGGALAGLALTLFVLGCWRLDGGLLERLDRAGYDFLCRLRQDLDPSSEIVIVAADEASLEREGPWPWPRERAAELLSRIEAAGPRVIALDALYDRPDRNPALGEVESLRRRLAQLQARRPAFEAELSSAAARLDADAMLLAAMTTAQNVVVPIDLASDRPEDIPAALARHALAEKATAGAPTAERQARRARAPLEPLLAAAAAAGHRRAYLDSDGVLRGEAAVVRVADRYVLSYALAAAALHLGRPAASARLVPGRGLEVAGVSVPLDESNSMRVTFNGPDHTFRHYPAYQVLDGQIAAEVFRDKLVLVGPTAGPAASYRVPVARELPAVEFAANVAENVLDRRFVSRPAWAAEAELAALLLCALAVILLFPRMRPARAALAAALAGAALWAASAWLFHERGEWLKAVYPSFLLGAGWFLRVLSAAAGAAPEPAAAPAPAAAAPPAPARKEGPPTRLGRYEFLRELGRGAMGVVYLAKDPKLGREVAVKTIKAEEGATPEETRSIRQRLLREAESAGALDHPGIVRVYDAGEEGGLCYVAMEPVSGESLAKLAAREGPLPVARALEAVAQVADALDYAHQKGIVHRDVKPANLMVGEGGRVRVTDFGIARAASAASTASGPVIGTPAYMSPEQIAGGKVDGRSDLFSLGVVLFELLSGRRPFEADNMGALLLQITNRPEADILSLRPGLPAGVARVVAKALKKSPDERYRSGAEMAADLRACAQEEGKPAAAPAAAQAAPQPVPRPVPQPAPTDTLTPEEIARTLVLPGEESTLPVPEAGETAAIGDGLEETLSLSDLEAILPDVPEAGKTDIKLRLPDEPR